MFEFIWPLGLIVISNVFYQICTKSVPNDISPFLSLGVTYIIGAAVSFVLYFVLSKETNILHECAKLNWAPFALGFAVVGLEVGYVFAYQAGWHVSLLPIVQSAILAAILIFVGYALYKEAITWNKVAGIIVCLAGLGLISLK